MTPEQHLAHLVRLIQPPTTNGWWAYAKARAEELAMQDSAHASLPVLLNAERERIRAAAEAASPPPKRRTSKQASTAPSSNVSRETMAATSRSAASKSSTGQHVFS